MLVSGCVVISDRYLFQETVLLNPCLMFSKKLMLSLKYLSGIVTSLFRGDIGGFCCCGGWVLSRFRGGCAGCGSRTDNFPFFSYT